MKANQLEAPTMATHTLIVCGVLAFHCNGGCTIEQRGQWWTLLNRTLSETACSRRAFCLTSRSLSTQATFVGITMNHYDGREPCRGWSMVFNGALQSRLGVSQRNFTPSIRIALNCLVITPNSGSTEPVLRLDDNGKEIREC
jgi:hypothetical protein